MATATEYGQDYGHAPPQNNISNVPIQGRRPITYPSRPWYGKSFLKSIRRYESDRSSHRRSDHITISSCPAQTVVNQAREIGDNTKDSGTAKVGYCGESIEDHKGR